MMGFLFKQKQDRTACPGLMKSWGGGLGLRNFWAIAMIPIGIKEGSRWLSAATPPVTSFFNPPTNRHKNLSSEATDKSNFLSAQAYPCTTPSGDSCQTNTISSPRPRRWTRSKQRNGLSLLEVILSVAILGGSMVMIGNLYHLGYRSALKARLINEGNLLAGATMAELAAGVLPIESTSDTSLPDNPDWTYAIDVKSSQQPGLFLATVSVKREGAPGQVSTSISIIRFIPDPDYEPEEDME